MELLFIFLYGAIIGLIARYALPGRVLHGALLVPALGAASAMLLWEILTWAGMKWDGGWIWVITLIVAAAVPALGDLWLRRVRTAADAALEAAVARGAA